MLNRKGWFHHSAWDALSENFVFEKCFCLSALSAAHLAELETTCHLCFFSSPWQSGANDLEGKTVPLHMGLTACVSLCPVYGHVCTHADTYLCTYGCTCLFICGFTLMCPHLCMCSQVVMHLHVCVYVHLCWCVCANSGLGPFLQHSESPSASGPVVLPASRVIRTGHADQ